MDMGCISSSPSHSAIPAPGWTLNAQEYFEKPGLSVLVFHNYYPEGKQGGIEIIQHGERIAAVGDVRLEATPGQWSKLPTVGNRTVDRSAQRVEVPLRFVKEQVGYHPQQEKRAVIELDPDNVSPGEATLMRIDPVEGLVPILSRPLTHWGRFLRYDYAVFDFTAVREPGVYVLHFRDGQTLPFRIAADVYKKGVWQPTLETFFPVQMCHMRVVDRGRVWHGVCYLDDALQAPPNLDLSYVEGYQQGPTTDTPYSAYMHIPGLNRGAGTGAARYHRRGVHTPLEQGRGAIRSGAAWETRPKSLWRAL